MKATTFGSLGRIVMVAAALTMGLSACGPPPITAKRASVTAGTMPTDAKWDGVYYSPLFGFLHVAQTGQLVHGKWERPRKDKVGELKGNVDGNLLRFDWTEYTVGLVGPNSRRTGKGYLVYTRPEGENVDDLVNGEAGLGENEVGMPWKAVKQRNVDANLDSIGGAGSSDLGGGDWDGKNRESGDAEPPAAPESDGATEEDAEGEADSAPESMK